MLYDDIKQLEYYQWLYLANLPEQTVAIFFQCLHFTCLLILIDLNALEI